MVLEAFTLVFQPMCLLLILIGVIVGIIFGSIPGLSATMAVVLFLPMSFGMTPMNGWFISGRNFRRTYLCHPAENPRHPVFHLHRI